MENLLQTIANSPTIAHALDATNSTISNVHGQYTKWAAQTPNAAKDLESTVNVASLLPIGKGAGIAADAANSATSACDHAGPAARSAPERRPRPGQ